MSNSKFLLNNKLRNYLIHGQPLYYKYEIPNAWFVVIRYENELAHNYERLKWLKKKYYFKKNRGVFENFTNAYSPIIEFYCFGFGFWKITKNFKVNFVNVKLPDLEIKCEPLKLENQFGINKPLLNFNIKKSNFSNIFFNKNTFSILSNEYKIKDFNDFEKYNQDYKTN